MIGRLKGYIFCAAILIVRCSASLGTGSPTFTSTPRGFDSRTTTKRLGGSAWSQRRGTHPPPLRVPPPRANLFAPGVPFRPFENAPEGGRDRAFGLRVSNCWH